MPDVYKILKDIELKAVGLDPQTNAMQEGYYVSFRDIGLPIHAEDYENPYSPLGLNLAKNIPPTPPADPATAPKTASASLDTNKIFTANIGRSMQNFLNTFLLTDSQLRMNGSYAVMPGAAHVSDAWYALITGANGIPTTTEISDDLKVAYAAAAARLMDAEDEPTAHYQSYMRYQDEWRDKVKAWRKAYAAVFTDPMKLQNWPLDGVVYEDEANEAWDRWSGLGHKEEIENAIATLAAQGSDPAIALIARAKKRFVNSLLEFQSVGQIPYTLMSPEKWYDPDDDDGWNTYTSGDFHSGVHYTTSSTSYGGGGGLSIGLFSAAGGFEHSEDKQSLDVDMSDAEVTFSYAIVDIHRPWLDSTLLSLRNWFLMGDYDRGCISDGTMGQQRATVDPTFFPSVVTSLILVKDLKLTWSNYSSDQATVASATSGGATVGYGPFAVSGHYGHSSGIGDFSVEATDEGLQTHGIQLLGYVSAINPLSPAVNSSDYLVQAPH